MINKILCLLGCHDWWEYEDKIKGVFWSCPDCGRIEAYYKIRGKYIRKKTREQFNADRLTCLK